MKKRRASTYVMLALVAFMLLIIVQQQREIQRLEVLSTPRGTFQTRPDGKMYEASFFGDDSGEYTLRVEGETESGTYKATEGNSYVLTPGKIMPMITLLQDSLVFFDRESNEPVIVPFVGEVPLQLR